MLLCEFNIFTFILIVCAACFGVFYWQFLKFRPCRCKDSLEGKTVVITGGTAGIGYQTATELAKRGARVIFTCRNIIKGAMAQKKIIKASKNQQVMYHALELTSFASIRRFVDNMIKTEERIDILINNAGSAYGGNFLTDDSVVSDAQVNFYGPYLLTRLLIDLMKRSAPSRIINVSSSLHRWGWIHPATFDHPVHGYWARKRQFADCKLATILFTMKLHKELRGTGVTANCFSPGFVFSKHWGPWPQLWKPVVRFMMRTPKHGAQTAIHLAVASSLDNVSGQYYEDCKPVTPSSLALNGTVADRLWSASERVVGLRNRYF